MYLILRESGESAELLSLESLSYYRNPAQSFFFFYVMRPLFKSIMSEWDPLQSLHSPVFSQMCSLFFHFFNVCLSSILEKCTRAASFLLSHTFPSTQYVGTFSDCMRKKSTGISKRVTYNFVNIMLCGVKPYLNALDS